MGFRKDFFNNLLAAIPSNDPSAAILQKSLAFFDKVVVNSDCLDKIKLRDIRLYNIENDSSLFDGSLLPQIQSSKDLFKTASDALKDIESTKTSYKLVDLNSNYTANLSARFKPKHNIFPSQLQNHEHRRHRFEVQARFRLYQVLSNLNGIKQEAMQVISGKYVDEEVFKKVFQGFKKEPLLLSSGNAQIFETPKDIKSFQQYLKLIQSKKHSQRAIRRNEPAPAQMTIPDDLCHYSSKELRTLTVREMARLQSFPDWFVFRAKVTTGGQQRCYEVPQYTQVGNAVPPLLAYNLGLTLKNLLNKVK